MATDGRLFSEDASRDLVARVSLGDGAAVTTLLQQQLPGLRAYTRIAPKRDPADYCSV